MNRRTLSAIVAVLGLVVIGLAVASATVWRPSSTAQTTMAAAPTTAYVVTAPGVLGVVDSDVTVTATAADPDSPVVIAVGRSEDVTAWLATDPYTEITGLSDWQTLTSTEVTESCPADATSAPTDGASATAASATASGSASDSATAASQGCATREATGADPSGSDLWLTEKTQTGTVTLDLDASDPDLVVLVATDGTEPAPDLSLSWPRAVSTPWLVPGLVLGGLLVLVGIFSLVLEIQLDRQAAERKARAAERAARRAAADSTATSVMAALGSDQDRRLTRREQREKERAEAAGDEWRDPRTGVVHRVGIEIPDVPQAIEEPPGAGPLVDEGVNASETDGVGTQAPEAATEREAVVGGGGAVVPGLDDSTTASYRRSRELEDDAPLTLADDPEDAAEVASELPSPTDATAEVPAVDADLAGDADQAGDASGAAEGADPIWSQEPATEPTDNHEDNHEEQA